MRYIDSEKLIAEIERLNKENNELRKNGGSIGQEFLFGIGAGYADVLKIIEPLQQEQPDKYETALEKAREWMPNVNQGGHAILISIFPELGEGLDPRYGGRKQDQPEVDLENYLENYFKWWHVEEEIGLTKPDGWSCIVDDLKDIARHFYKLGLNARGNE